MIKFPDIELLERHIAGGLIRRSKHPEYDLYIYKYAQIVQLSRQWDHVTTLCRGIILDSEYNIIAKPFDKFFNTTEHQSLPDLEFNVYDKFDGSLGIVYYYNDQWNVATPGSFVSPQATYARNILDLVDLSFLNEDNTYLIEIIYPENRVVVKYDHISLVLLAIFDRTTLNEINIDLYAKPWKALTNGAVKFEVAEPLDHLRPMSLSDLNNTFRSGIEMEGYVIKYSNGLRVKLKSPDYVRLHKTFTNLMLYDLWEHCMLDTVDSLLDLIPDEAFNEIREIVNGFDIEYHRILTTVEADFISIYDPKKSRKELVPSILKTKYPGLVFAFMDGKSLRKSIYNIIRPKENRQLFLYDSTGSN